MCIKPVVIWTAHFYGQLKSFALPLALSIILCRMVLKCGAAQQVHLTGTLLMVVPAKLEIYESNSLSQKKPSLWATLDCKWTRWHLKRDCLRKDWYKHVLFYGGKFKWEDSRLFVSLFNYRANLCLMSWVVHLETRRDRHTLKGILNYWHRTFTIELFLLQTNHTFNLSVYTIHFKLYTSFVHILSWLCSEEFKALRDIRKKTLIRFSELWFSSQLVHLRGSP